MASPVSIATVAAEFVTLSGGRLSRFDEMAWAVFRFQRARNPVYERFCAAYPGAAWPAVPYLPVDAFKYAPVATFAPEQAEAVFESSGTGSGQPSQHYVRRLAVYERAVCAHFEAVFGAGPFTIVAHLPGYAARGRRSSLVYMMHTLMARYGDAASGFFLEDRTVLDRAVYHSRTTATPLLLFGAAFGLLDLVEADRVSLPVGARVVETGGMKTYRREVTRAALHAALAEGFGIARPQVWSEYGMCELMSQCYTRGGTRFFPPPWMQFRVVDPDDPARDTREGEPGALALFDLANLYSVSAIQTQDLAVRRGTGFEVLGRLSQAELRGCNFLLEDGDGPA
jgi:hypothetical protein